MRFKKFLAAICAVGLLMTGCGSEQGGSNTKDPNSQETIINLGMITRLNATEKTMDEIYNKIFEETKLKFTPYKISYYDNLKTMQMGIESGIVDEISVYDSVANYLIANNDKYVVVEEKSSNDLSDSFCFAIRKDDSALKAAIDKAIEEMKADGTLDKLVKDYITDVDKENPPAVEIPMTNGADTIKIGVTGDLPPLDYVSADGKPAGFNTAILAEIAKRLGKNIEIIDIDSGARAAALSSKQIDVIFWAILPVNDNMPSYIDKPEGVELSMPYFRDNVTHLKLKK